MLRKGPTSRNGRETSANIAVVAETKYLESKPGRIIEMYVFALVDLLRVRAMAASGRPWRRHMLTWPSPQLPTCRQTPAIPSLLAPL